MDTITYTFPADCPVLALRGVTVTGGTLCRLDGRWDGEPDAVRFVTTVAGKPVVARIAGKPELEAALAVRLEHDRAISARLTDLGWPAYQIVQERVFAARDKYEAASQYGYPAREAQALAAAEAALRAAATTYPLAALYAKAEVYSLAVNDGKANAGARAMRAIEAGADPVSVVADMERDWLREAERSANNA